jgi:hypothetical protein
MKTITIPFFLSLIICISACVGHPVVSSTPSVIEVRISKPPVQPSLATTEVTKTPDRRPTVSLEIVETITLTPTINPKPVFKTSLGELLINTVRWVDEVNGVSPGPDERLMLIVLGKPGLTQFDKSKFSLETFDKALRDQSSGEVHISADDGSYAVCSMAGWVGPKYEEFAMGFRLPATAKTFQLYWPGNAPIDLYPEN